MRAYGSIALVARRVRRPTEKVGNRRVHGDAARFGVVANYINERFGGSVRYVADVAGGQGILARELKKRYNYTVEVIDPRGWTLKGIDARSVPYSAEDAAYYDLVVGLHPDSALPEVVHSALHRSTVCVPCCNFWSREERLGREALAEAISGWYADHGVVFERVELPFRGPHNFAFVTTPRPS